MKKSRIFSVVLVMALTLLFTAGRGTAQDAGPSNPEAALGTAFTYQGQISRNGSPVNGACDLQFTLWNAPTSGTQVGSASTITGVSLVHGSFSTLVNGSGAFGTNAFTGEERWLQIAVLCSGDAVYTTLAPRQALTPAPYALALPGFYTQQNATSPNLIGGYIGNSVNSGVYGATISGGGASIYINIVAANYGTVGGGRQNTASGLAASVGGGENNTASVMYTSVGGGQNNTASGYYAGVGGGTGNAASGSYASVGGGNVNAASGTAASVGGGWTNTASGYYATIPGGRSNRAQGNYSFAAGYRAKADHEGTFVWADHTDVDFTSSLANQFLIRASGGVGIGTDTPVAQLHVYSTAGDTAVFESWKGGNASNIHYGINGDWYIRSANSAGKVVLQDTGGYVGIGTNNPQSTLHVAGTLRVDTLASGGVSLCYNPGLFELATCTSSLRYKQNVAGLSLGLETIAQLRPVTFDWKSTGEPDLGFVAEEVDQVTSLLTTRNAAGEIEGVKYDRISAVLVNAVQEQQAQIADLEAQVAALEQGTGGGGASPLATPWPWMALSIITLGGMGMVFLRRPGGGR